MNPAHALKFCFFKINFNTVLSSAYTSHSKFQTSCQFSTAEVPNSPSKSQAYVKFPIVMIYLRREVSPSPNKLEGHPQSAVGDNLFSIFAAIFNTGTGRLPHSQLEHAPRRGDRHPLNMDPYSELLRAGRSRDRISVGMRFSAPVQTFPGANPASYTMGTR
jgi:hypothetical protein